MKRTPRLIAMLVVVMFLSPSFAGEPKNLGFQVPDGFEVTLYADDSLATDIHALTIDAHGRVVVASKGYIKILHDTKGVGKANKATVFADFPKSGAHGMYFDGDDLICDGDKGVRRLYDTKGVGRCDKVSPPFFATKNDGEHAANGIVRGPDGWYYLVTGNDAGITPEHAGTAVSPIKIPNSGTILRFSPDGKIHEIFAHGFRNPYDLAFNHLGQLFTVDSDGERVCHLPYYAPTRLFDVAQGMHHGWPQSGWIRSWSKPAAWPDNVERLVEIGRGSPTGAVVYRHRAFPERYRNGVFSLCWTFGRVYFMPLTRHGSTYVGKLEVFMRTTGDVGFAPTGMAVGSDGDLFIAIGGRGTRGSVFRVHYKGAVPAGPSDPLRAVLAADQPLSSWSRARWVPEAKKLGREPFVSALFDAKLPLEERLRAVEILTELFRGVPVAAARKICTGVVEPELAARTIWSLSRKADALEAHRLMAEMTKSADPRVARAAWEALAVIPPFDPVHLTPDWHAGLNSPDRRVRAAAILVARGAGNRSFEAAFFPANVNQVSFAERLAYFWVKGMPEPKDEDYRNLFYSECARRPAESVSPMLRLEAIRLLQLALGDVDLAEGPEKAFVGYVAKSPAKFEPSLRKSVAENLVPMFPSGNADVDQELARLLGMLETEVPGLLEKLAGKWTKDSTAEDDIHYLLVSARLPGKRSHEVSRKTAAALNGIQVKLAKRGAVPSDFVPSILEALLERLMKHDPALASALVADPAFGLPSHALYANKLTGADKQQAARKILAQVAKLDEDRIRAAWTPELVRLAGILPDEEALPVLRTQFADARLTDTVALLLADKRRPDDRGRFVQALNSTQPIVVRAAAEALAALPNSKITPTDIGKAVRALKRNPAPDAETARQILVKLLEHWTSQKVEPDNPKETPADAWVRWFTKTYPQEASTLPGLASANFATWKKRLDSIDWTGGDEKQGETVFQRKTCYRCHGETRRLGPDLAGVGQRFSRDDLFTAILDPSKDIAPAFRSTSVVTKSGKVHNGMIIYESQEIVLLQTTPDTTVRVPSEEIDVVQPSNISFMPTGLLDDLSDQDLRDLYAYLKGLRKR